MSCTAEFGLDRHPHDLVQPYLDAADALAVVAAADVDERATRVAHDQEG